MFFCSGCSVDLLDVYSMSGFSGGSKIQMERVYAILEAVKGGGYPNCRKLGEILECSAKTVQRDVTFMQDRLNVPMAYNAGQHGYEMVSEVDDLPIFDVQVEDLAGLFLARHALAGMRGTKLAESLLPAFEKLTRQLEGKVSMNWRSMDQAFSVKESGVVEADLTLFGKLAEAVLKERVVSFMYRKLGGAKSEKRVLEPYHVGEIDGGWYVIGRDVERDGLRTFALQRVKGLVVGKDEFVRPRDFQIGEHLGGSIGVWSDGVSGDEEVVVEVDGWVARVVQERIWHPSQEIRVLDDMGERVEVRMWLSSFEDLVGLVLSWGRHARVISPRELQGRVADEVRGMAANY